MWSTIACSRFRVALAVALVCWSFSPAALAFCRTTTCSLGKTNDEALVECAQKDGCISEGAPLHWQSPCLRYAVQADGSPASGFDPDQLAAMVNEAFLLWQSADCPGGGRPNFQADFQGFVSCHEQEAVCAGVDGNVSVVMFYDSDWPNGSNELGLTTPVAGISSGVLSDADIQINSGAIIGSPSYELFPVIAHEVGHYLGLAHSNVESALMSMGYSSLGVSGDLLTADDVAGICAIYPPSQRALSCKPVAPTYDACQNPDPLEQCSMAAVRHDSGCSIAPPSSRPAPLALIALGVGLALLARRRSTR